MSHFIESAKKEMGSAVSLSNQIRSLIQIRTQSHWEKGRYSGRIHGAHLPFVSVGKENVFKKKNSPLVVTDAAFSFLGDASGSMSFKFHYLAAAYGMVNEAIKPLGVPFELLCFSEKFGGDPWFFVVKGYNENISTDEILNRMEIVSRYLQDNPDGEALLWAYSRLRIRREKKKILVVLSDGKPETGTEGDSSEHLKYICQELDKRITLYGIGLQSDDVTKYYKNRFLVNTGHDLETMFLNLVKKELLV